ncbi:hypothetical protein [Nocardioides sp.]|uniref:hypothetical protein n=1 Tax=Nocardioides sp. TaxID=35761 RepID=UPI002605A0B4|nr:hypothetical protein [Nocardioides sp.]MCW2737964.1 major facilitator transporter [Nocardioides sp.]
MRSRSKDALLVVLTLLTAISHASFIGAPGWPSDQPIASAAVLPWLMTTTLLTAALAVTVSNSLVVAHGSTRVVLGAAGALCLGSALGAAFADSLPALIAARLLQGMSAVAVPVALTPAIGGTQRAVGAGAALAIGTVLGVPVGSLLFDVGGLSLLFAGPAIVGAVVLAGLATAGHVSTSSGVPVDIPTPDLAVDRHAHLVTDLTSGLSLAVGLGAMSQASLGRWTTASVLVTAAAAVAVVAYRRARGLAPSEGRIGGGRLRSGLRLPILHAASALLGFAMFANLMALGLASPAAGDALGLRTFVICLVGAVLSAVTVLVSSLGGGRRAASRTLVTGCGAASAGFALNLSQESSWVVVAGTLACFVGISMAYAALPVVCAAAVAPRPATHTAARNTLYRSLGTAAASVLLGTTGATGPHAGGALAAASAGLLALVSTRSDRHRP